MDNYCEKEKSEDCVKHKEKGTQNVIVGAKYIRNRTQKY
jgi:hypothetical protein